MVPKMIKGGQQVNKKPKYWSKMIKKTVMNWSKK